MVLNKGDHVSLLTIMGNQCDHFSFSPSLICHHTKLLHIANPRAFIGISRSPCGYPHHQHEK
jgi:hypothetical protein